MATPILIPLLNPNETEARIVHLPVENGQHVRTGEVICTLETTKSAADLEAPQDGFIVSLAGRQGQSMRAGDTLCFVSEDPSWSPPVQAQDQLAVDSTDAGEDALPAGLRITRPALTLARQSGMDLTTIPSTQLVTLEVVRSMVSAGLGPETEIISSDEFDPTSIIIYGAGGHGKSLIELIRATGLYRIHGIIDDHIPAGGQVLGVPVLGNSEILSELYAKGIRLAANAVGGIGNIEIRLGVFRRLSAAGFSCPALIHPRAFIEPSATVAPGVQIMPLAYVGSETHIGFGCIVNTGAIISHDCRLGEIANIAPGAILAGEVQVGERVLVGMGVTVNLQVKIGSGARLGNGSTVKEDVPENGIVRAGAIWP